MKTKLVVYNDDALGYIQPELPDVVQVLHCSPLKYPHAGWISSFQINKTDNVRLASEKDFEEYRVSFKSYENKEIYEYAEN